MSYSTEAKIDVPLVAAVELICQVMTSTRVYTKETDSSEFFFKITNIIYCLAISTLLSMLNTYIVIIRSKILDLTVENLGLLDEMHEGLILVSSGKSEDQQQL